jgi:hypothetical protein
MLRFRHGSNTPGRQGVDWFERVFHLDPDHGNGMFELAILVLLVLVISTIVYRFRGRAARKAAESDDRR